MLTTFSQDLPCTIELQHLLSPRKTDSWPKKVSFVGRCHASLTWVFGRKGECFETSKPRLPCSFWIPSGPQPMEKPAGQVEGGDTVATSRSRLPTVHYFECCVCGDAPCTNGQQAQDSFGREHSTRTGITDLGPWPPFPTNFWPWSMEHSRPLTALR